MNMQGTMEVVAMGIRAAMETGAGVMGPGMAGGTGTGTGTGVGSVAGGAAILLVLDLSTAGCPRPWECAAPRRPGLRQTLSTASAFHWVGSWAPRAGLRNYFATEMELLASVATSGTPFATLVPQKRTRRAPPLQCRRCPLCWHLESPGPRHTPWVTLQLNAC